jgi:hypothetical protein
LAGTYNRNTYNSALYNAGRDDRGAIIRSIIQAHTGPHIQAVVGADPRLPANQSGVSFITDFTIIEGTVRKPPLCYNFPDLKAVMRVMQTGSQDLPAAVYAQQYFDMPACTYPVAFLPELRAFIFAYIEQDLGADIFGILAQLDLAAIIQIVQEDLGGFILGIESPVLGGRVFSQLAPNLGGIIWSPTDLPAAIIPVIFSDLPGAIFAFNFDDMPAKMLGIAAPQLFARIKGFASATADLPAVLFSRLEEYLGAQVTAQYPGPNDMTGVIAHDGGSDFNNMLGVLRSRNPGDGDLIATIGREFEVEFDLAARVNFLSAITIAASISPWKLGVNDRFLAGILQPVHTSDIPASIESNENLKNLTATIEALAGTTDLGAFLRAAETFVTALLTVSTLNAYDLRATIGNPACEGGSANLLLNAYANAQHAKDVGGFIQSFIEFNLGATINLKEIFYAVDFIPVTFTPRPNRPVLFLTTDTIPVTFSPFRGLNLGAVITAGQPRIDLPALINAVLLLPRVDPAVSSMTAMELRPDRDFDVQEVRFQMEGELLDYFYVNGTDDAFISDGSQDWKINIRSFREIAVGLFGEFAAGRVCRLGNLTSYATLDEAVRNCIAVVIGQQGEAEMSASVFVSGGVVSLPAILSASDTFGDLSARSNTMYPIDLSAVIGVDSYNPVNLQGIIGGVKSEVATMNAFIALNNQVPLAAAIGASGQISNLPASIPKVWKFASILASLNIFNNQFALLLNPEESDTNYVEGPSMDDLGLVAGVGQPFTASLWFRLDRGHTPVLYESIAGGSSSFAWSDGFGFYWADPTTVRFWYRSWQFYFVSAALDSTLPYMHLVGVYDGFDVHFYVNGVFAGTSNTAPGGQDRGAVGSDFQIGRISNTGVGSTQYAQGIYEDVAFWKRALTANEISELFNDSVGWDDLNVAGTYYDPDQLRLWWDTDNTVANETYPIIEDRSPGNFNGTYVGAPVDQNDVIVEDIPRQNNVSVDFTSPNTYYRTTTSDNGVPVNGTGDFSVMVVLRNSKFDYSMPVGAWNSSQTAGSEPSFRIKKHNSGFGHVTNVETTNTGGTAYYANIVSPTDTTGTTWYNWIFTFNSSTGRTRAYNNGVFNAQSPALAGTRKDWSEFTIGAGRWTNSITDYHDGEINTVAVWDTVLSVEDIDAIWNNGNTEANLKSVGPDTNLQAWYRLGEAGDTVTLLQDRSGNGHHMVRVGSNSTIVTNVPN